MVPKFYLLSIFALALLLRFFLIISAHHGDLNNNISWGQVAFERGLNGFYGSANSDDWPYSAPNQPPLYILLYTFCVIIWQAIKDVAWNLNSILSIFPSEFVWFWNEHGLDIMVKLPSIIADIGIGWMIYHYITYKAKKGFTSGLTFAAIWLFNPVIWYNSSVWGQTDSIVNFLGLVAIFFLLDKKLLESGIFLTLSLLFKGSLAIFVPLFLYVSYRQNHTIKTWIKTAFYSLGVIIAISFWFHPYPDFPLWMTFLYKERILPGEIGYLTANAFNFWWLVDPTNTYDSVILFGLPARLWGIIIALLGMVGTIFWFKNKKISGINMFAALVLTSLITFLFMTRIHERYLYPFFPYATLFSALSPGFLPYYFLISLLHLLNLYHLFWFPPLMVLENWFLIGNLASFISILNLILFFVVLRHLRAAKI